jgi:benzoate-CoA ligase
MLKVSGIWVSPSEVEFVISVRPAVLECAVVGIVDEQRLMPPEAFVVLQPGRHGDAAMVWELREYMRSVLAHYRCRRAFNFVDELPRTAMGKIFRYKLREAPAHPGTPYRPPANSYEAASKRRVR